MTPNNSQDDFDAKPRRIGDSKRGRSERYVTLVMRPLGRSERGRRKLGLIAQDATFNRGVGVGLRAAAGLIEPGGRRVTAWVRYMFSRVCFASLRLRAVSVVLRKSDLGIACAPEFE